MDVVGRAFEQLDIKGRFEPAVGMPVQREWLDRSAGGNGRDLPVGTVLSIGYPEDYPVFGLVKKNPSGGFDLVFGEVADLARGVLRVAALPDDYRGDQSWFTAPPQEGDAELLRRFKSKAWQVGMRVKDHHGWCGEFERYYSQVGLTAKVALATQGSPATSEQIRALPEGAILYFTNGQTYDQWAYYVRANTSSNSAGTLRVMSSPGWANPGHMQRNMSVLWNGQVGSLAEARVPVQGASEMVAAPVGSQIQQTSDESNWWQKRESGQWYHRGEARGLTEVSFTGHPTTWVWRRLAANQ
jgi:hypothetical protein